MIPRATPSALLTHSRTHTSNPTHPGTRFKNKKGLMQEIQETFFGAGRFHLLFLFYLHDDIRSCLLEGLLWINLIWHVSHGYREGSAGWDKCLLFDSRSLKLTVYQISPPACVSLWRAHTVPSHVWCVRTRRCACVVVALSKAHMLNKEQQVFCAYHFKIDALCYRIK